MLHLLSIMLLTGLLVAVLVQGQAGMGFTLLWSGPLTVAGVAHTGAEEHGLRKVRENGPDPLLVVQSSLCVIFFCSSVMKDILLWEFRAGYNTQLVFYSFSFWFLLV